MTDFYLNVIQSTPLVTGTGRSRIVCQRLNTIREWVLKSLPVDKYPKLDSSISWVVENFLEFLGLSFNFFGKKVSNSLSVVICFARDGRGMVVGLMSATALKTDLKTVSRDKTIDFLDVSSFSKTRYNNKFINPEEFLAGKFVAGVCVGDSHVDVVA